MNFSNFFNVNPISSSFNNSQLTNLCKRRRSRTFLTIDEEKDLITKDEISKTVLKQRRKRINIKPKRYIGELEEFNTCK